MSDTEKTSSNPIPPKIGDYVLATKYSDGQPGDPMSVGFYAGVEYGDRHMVHDANGENLRANGFGRVGRITHAMGTWLLANHDLLATSPVKLRLWDMHDWATINDQVREVDEDSPVAETSELAFHRQV